MLHHLFICSSAPLFTTRTPYIIPAMTHAPAQFDKALAAKVRVRPLEPDDSLAHLTYLLHRAYKQHVDRGIKALAAFQPEEVTRRRIAGGECFVATHMGRIVGTVLFKDATRTAADGVGGSSSIEWFTNAGVASFSQFAVEPEYQGHGVGGVLVGTAEQRARETGAAELGLSTPEPATWLVAMYERH